MSNVVMTPECEEYIGKIREKARELGFESLESFEKALNYVAQRDSWFGKKARVRISKEMFSETDLYWVLETINPDGTFTFQMNGGINFHSYDNKWSVNT